jgi:PCI domain
LSIFTKTDAKNFKEALNGFAKLIQEEKLTKEELILKKSYVEICSLSTEKTNFKFSDLANLLNLDLNEVEEWAIEAISKKIIDAKID